MLGLGVLAGLFWWAVGTERVGELKALNVVFTKRHDDQVKHSHVNAFARRRSRTTTTTTTTTITTTTASLPRAPRALDELHTAGSLASLPSAGLTTASGLLHSAGLPPHLQNYYRS